MSIGDDAVIYLDVKLPTVPCAGAAGPLNRGWMGACSTLVLLGIAVSPMALSIRSFVNPRFAQSLWTNQIV